MALMSAATGGAAGRVFREPTISVVTTDFNLAEAKEHIPELIGRYHLDPDDVADALAALPLRLYRWGEYESYVAEARALIERKDPKDVALLALALKLGLGPVPGPVASSRDHDCEREDHRGEAP